MLRRFRQPPGARRPPHPDPAPVDAAGPAPAADLDLAALAAGLERPMALADVGGRWGPADRWRALAPPLHIVSFEPDAEECERLRARSDPQGTVRYEAVALGARAGDATLHLTRDPACASLYPPDAEAVAAHSELEVAAPAGERTVTLQTLDGWAAGAGVCFDAVKLDVQGAELDVLTGGQEQLRHVVGLEVEVELNPIYRGQPLLGDVDRFLRDRGFVLWRLGHLVHYARHGLDGEVDVADQQAFDSRHVPVAARGGQLFWAHAWYVASDLLEGANGRRAACGAIAAGAFGFPDLARMLARSTGMR